MRRAVVVAAGLAVGLGASAAFADDAPVAVTLAQVLEAAPRSPAAQVSGHEIAAAVALIDAAGAWPAPALRIETNRLTARLVAGATVPLPLFGTVGALEREAEAQAEAIRSAAAVDQREIRRRAVAAWIGLARADGDVVATEIAAKHAAEIERIARARLDAGEGADVDVTTAGAARARAALAAAAAKRAREAASAELAGILGWDPLASLQAAGALPIGEPTTLDALRTRLPAHPERALAQRRVLAAEATVAQVRSLRWPTLAVEGQVSLRDPTQPGTDVLVGLTLDLPVFSRTAARARSAEALAAAERARVTVTETQLGAMLVATYRRWQAAAERLASLEHDVVPAQERAATLSAQAYREGARDLASALLADRDLAAVRAEVNAARADAAAAWTDLQVAAGDDLGGPSAR